tara:strand:+ start:67 stop:531 length:465 start_codon:yes stop_codon:yes gene_type:complete
MRKNNHIRPATIHDLDLIFTWSNDKQVRKNSFNNSKIRYSNHKIWFKKNIKKKSIFIFANGKKLLGLIRISDFNKGIKISYSISKENRGKNLGSKMINFFCNKLKKNRKFKKKKVYAFVIKKNNASKKTLLRSSFKYLGIRYKKECYTRIIDEN